MSSRQPSRKRRQKMPHWLEKRPTTSTGVAIPWMHTEESEDDECARKRTPTENGVTGDSDKNDILQVLQRIRSMRAAVEGTLISP